MIHSVPRRPHFVLHWRRVGRVDEGPQFAFSLMSLDTTVGLYLLFSKRTVIQYIGIAFSQSLGKRVGQHLQGIRRVGGSLGPDTHLYVAIIAPRAYRRLSRKMLEEIESYFVWAIQPPGNTAKRVAYRGREMLLENAGDDFGLPRFLYVCPCGEHAVVGQGEEADQLKVRTIQGRRR